MDQPHKILYSSREGVGGGLEERTSFPPLSSCWALRGCGGSTQVAQSPSRGAPQNLISESARGGVELRLELLQVDPNPSCLHHHTCPHPSAPSRNPSTLKKTRLPALIASFTVRGVGSGSGIAPAGSGKAQSQDWLLNREGSCPLPACPAGSRKPGSRSQYGSRTDAKGILTMRHEDYRTQH